MAEQEQSWTDQAAAWASDTYEQAATAVSETYEQAAAWTNETVDGAVTWAAETYQDAETWVGEHADAATNSYGTTSGAAIAEKGVADAAEDAAANTEFMRVTWARTKYDLVLTKHQLLQRLSSAYADATTVQAQGDQADPHACEAIGHSLDADADTATSAVNLAAGSFADDADRFHQARLNILEAAGAARWGALIDAVDRQSHLDAVPTAITTAITILQGISEDGTDPDSYLPPTSY
jgi:hypothetical protein